MDALQYSLRYLSVEELGGVSLASKDIADLTNTEWHVRVIKKYGRVLYKSKDWRRCFILRRYLKTNIAKQLAGATVALAPTKIASATGLKAQEFRIEGGDYMICSRERAAIYSRCQHMFELSLRIHRSIQEVSNLAGVLSLSAAHTLIAEHTSLMVAVASLRASLMFESELFDSFPAPILLEPNTLLRGKFQLSERPTSEAYKMQIQVTLDHKLYRTVCIPTKLDTSTSIAYQQDTKEDSASSIDTKTVRFHELSGLDTRIDDNTIRYRVDERNELCVNALISNSYLLYLFNPLGFNPLNYTYEANLTISGVVYPLPLVKERVFLHKESSTLRIYFCYGRYPTEVETLADEKEPVQLHHRTGEFVSAKEQLPLAIPYTDTSRLDIELLAKEEESGQVHTVMEKNDQSLLPPTWQAMNATKSEWHSHALGDTIICCGSMKGKIHYVECAIGLEALIAQVLHKT